MNHRSFATNNLVRLIGTWKTEGTVHGQNEQLVMQGQDSYELILDEQFILHKTNVLIGLEKNESFELIGRGDAPHTGTMRFFNSKAESGTMTCEFDGDDFFIHGDQLKFEGTINEHNTTLKGQWFTLDPNGAWVLYIEMELTKM